MQFPGSIDCRNRSHREGAMQRCSTIRALCLADVLDPVVRGGVTVWHRCGSSAGSFDGFSARISGAEISEEEEAAAAAEDCTISISPNPRSLLDCSHCLIPCQSRCSCMKLLNTGSSIDKSSCEPCCTPEMNMMKERFGKLLLGEDLSGGANGVCSALAISNAITNLAACIFGEVKRLEPLGHEWKQRWLRQMGWLLSISDHIVELVPSSHMLPNGNAVEVMLTRGRSDLQINLPALRKLDTMLLDALDNFTHTEFWYVDRGVTMSEDGRNSASWEGEKWWLPIPKVPCNGLSADARKQLHQQRNAISQILKAALTINAQVLSEMQVPSVYWDALPKNVKASLGETLYHAITSNNSLTDIITAAFDHNHENSIWELLNRLEAAICVWHTKTESKPTPRFKSSWSVYKDGFADMEHVEKAESVLTLLRQRFPGLPQTILDIAKIQYNKDVGHAIIESYSRVLESLASTILSRIDDILQEDDSITSRKYCEKFTNNNASSSTSGLELAQRNGLSRSVKTKSFLAFMHRNFKKDRLDAAKRQQNSGTLKWTELSCVSKISVVFNSPGNDC